MSRKSYKPSPPWLKVVSTKWLYGSIRFDLNPAERSVWIDLLALANESPLRGVVCASKGVPFPHEWLANTLNVPLDILESTITKCKIEGRITEDTGGIRITNWDFYQVDVSKERKGKKETKKQEPPEELTPEQLQKQTEMDARDLEEIRDQLPPERIAAAEKWKAEHPEK